MLTAHDIRKSLGVESLLDGVTFSINDGDRIGMIGPNGAGKSTLIKILAGKLTPDSGIISLNPKKLRVGYLAQGFSLDMNKSIGQFLGEISGNPEVLEHELRKISQQLVDSPDNEQLQTAYDRIVRIMAGYDFARTKSIVGSLGLSEVPAELTISKLSGGQKTRLSLAVVLLNEPELLLLDEPTNHLDIGMLEWLEKWLKDFYGAALIVSHDRAFLNQTVRKIFYLDPVSRKIRIYRGDYTDYLEQVISERDTQAAAYKAQVAEIRRIKQDIAKTKEQAKRVEMTTTPRQPGVRRIAKKVAVKAKSREKKLARYLDSDERIEKPKASWQLKLTFEDSRHLGRNVIDFENVTIGYSSKIPLLYIKDVHVQSGERIAVTGENGAGKTTLFKTLIGGLNPLGGRMHIGPSVKLGYMAQEQELLKNDSTPLQTIQTVSKMSVTDTRSFLHFFLFEGDDALRKVEELSFGERARLELALLVASGSNVLLLDEPINHLDIPSRERFEQALANYQGTVLAVVHDRYFIRRFATSIWLVENGELTTIIA